MRLPVTIEHHPDGMPLNFVSRLAAANGYSSVKLFWKTSRLKPIDVLQGSRSSLEKLSAISGAQSEVLRRHAVPRTSRAAVWTLGNAKFNGEFRIGNRYRYCPICVLDDVKTGTGRLHSRPYIRAAWATRAVENCVGHHVELVEHEPAAGQLQDFSQYVLQNLDVIKTEASQAQSVASLALDSYVEGRIRGVLKAPYPDQFEAYVVVVLSYNLGRFIQEHPKALKFIPAHLEAESAREVGFHLIDQGEARVREIVQWTLLEYRPPNATINAFGIFFARWLESAAKLSDFNKVAELFHDIAVRTLPLGPGDRSFLSVTKRYVHSVQTASLEYNLGRERVDRLLLDAGVLQDTTRPRGQNYFDAEIGHQILAEATETLNTREAFEYLGVTDAMIRRLINTRLVPTVELKSDDRAFHRIPRQGLEELKQRIVAACARSELSETMVPLTTIYRKCACRIDELVPLILDGTIHKVATAPGDIPVFKALRLDPEEISMVFTKLRTDQQPAFEAELLTHPQALRHLDALGRTVLHLTKMGLLSEATVRETSLNRVRTYYTLASLNEFKAEHIKISELAKQLGILSYRVYPALKEMGILPIFETFEFHTRFYRRSDVTHLTREALQ
jgi:TniQ